MTITGLLLIPIGLIAIIASWRWVFLILPSFAVLSGAAVVGLGSFGLQPGYFLALLIIGRTLMEMLVLKQPFRRPGLIAIIPLGILLLAAVVALWVALIFFQGKIVVIGGTDAYDLDNAAPYVFRRENMTQLAYLLIHIGLVYCLIHQAARLGPDEFLRLVDRAIITTIILATLICFWHLISYYNGLYYPNGFFFSNPGYFSAHDQGLLDGLRVNGPFSEPSGLAYNYSGFLLYSWKRLWVRKTVLSVVLIFGCIVAIFLSRSTTGFMVIGIFAMVVSYDVLRSWVGRPIRRFRVTKAGVHLSAWALIGICLGAWYLIENSSFVNELLTSLVLEKDKTSSFEQRNAVNVMAVDILVETGGLGIGLGSHKPNSAVLTLLSNTGFLGTAAFLAFISMVLWPRPIRRTDPVVGPYDPLSSIRWFTAGLLMINALTNPNLSIIMLWIGCGFVLGAALGYSQPPDLARVQRLP
jgi:hypothetical protein